MVYDIIQATQAGKVNLLASKKQPAKPKTNPTLEMVVNDFKSAWDYCAGSWHDRWSDNYKLYNNNRVKRNYNGTTDTFVPMVYPTIETMVASLFGMKPKFAYAPPSNKPDQNTEILNALLDYFWEKDQWSLKLINTGRDMFNLGTAIDYFVWNIDHPELINLPTRDFFIDPTATSLDNARFCGRRYLINKESLESYEIVNYETGKLEKRYKNLDKLEANSDPQEKTDKQEKDMLYGSTLSKPEDKQIEVIEYWTLDRVISVANRTEVIEDTENWFLARAKSLNIKDAKGILPFADARDIVDKSLFYAKGETDFIADQQELLNDQTNQCTDYVGFITNQMYTLDPKYADKVQEVENLQGTVYPFEANALQPIQQRNMPPEAFNERMNLKNEIRETAASSEMMRGVNTQGAGDPTATEVNAQMSGAGTRLNLKVTQLENGYFHRMAKIIFYMVRLYVTEPMMVRIVGKDGTQWEQFDPTDFQDGDYEPRVQLDITVQNQKQQQAYNAEKMMAMLLNDPDIDQRELKKLVLQRSFNLDPDEVELLMPKQEMQPMGSGMQITPDDMATLEQLPDEDLMALQQMGGANGFQAA